MAAKVYSKVSTPPQATEQATAVVHAEPLVASLQLEQSVLLAAWVRHKFGGHKHADQTAGFQHWCRANGHVRHPTALWDALYVEFNNRPVGR